MQVFKEPLASEKNAYGSTFSQKKLEGYCLAFERESRDYKLKIDGNKLVAEENPPPDAKPDWRPAVKINPKDDVLQNIREACIDYTLMYSRDIHQTYIYAVLTMDREKAIKWADDRDLPVLIDPKEAISIGRKYDFVLANRTCMGDGIDEETFKDRQGHEYKKLPMSLWRDIHLPFETSVPLELYKKYAPYNDILSNRLFLRVIYEILIDDRKLGGAQWNPQGRLQQRNYPLKQFFALNYDAVNYGDIVRPRLSREEIIYPQLFDPNIWTDRVQHIRSYYGELVAFYFAFLIHYTRSLRIVSILGTIWFVVQISAGEIAVPGSFVVIFISLLWSTFMIEGWYRKEWEYRYRWGVLGYEQAELPRPSFTGTLVVSPGTGELIETYKSRLLYYLKILFSMSTISLCVGIVIAVVVQIWVLQKKFSDNTGYRVLIGMVNSVQIQIFNRIYVTLAWWLNEIEGHRLQQDYYNHLVIKRIFFFIINSFNSLFYLAFYKTYDSNEQCLIAVRTQLITLFLTAIFIQNMMEIALPIAIVKFRERWQLYKESKHDHSLLHDHEDKHTHSHGHNHSHGYTGTVHDNGLTNVRKEESKNDEKDNMETENPQISFETLSDIEAQMEQVPSIDILDNTAEMVIQYGYIMLFVFVFPLMPLLAILNNYFEIRVDLYNLINSQRPAPSAASGIGVWKPVMSIFASVAVFTNMALLTWKTDNVRNFVNTHRDESSSQIEQRKIIVFFCVSFLILFLMFIIRAVIDDVPNDIQESIQRQEVCEKYLLTRPVKEFTRATVSNISDKEKEKIYASDDILSTVANTKSILQSIKTGFVEENV